MKQKITELLKVAMKEKNSLKVSVYRSLKADIETAEHNGESDVMAIVSKAAKKRSDSIDQYEKANRFDLASDESAELSIIRELLPKEPSESELTEAIESSVLSLGKNMGMIIKDVKSKYPTVDGKKLAGMVKEIISK